MVNSKGADMSLIKTVFKEFKIGNVTLQFPASQEAFCVTDTMLKKLTDTPAEVRKAQALIAVLAQHNLHITLVGFTQSEGVYWGTSKYPKNYFCKRGFGLNEQIIVLNKHFMLIVGDLENPQFVYDGHNVYTTAGKRNATKFINASEGKHAEFLAAVKVQMPLL
jgi:hypothetical protein